MERLMQRHNQLKLYIKVVILAKLTQSKPVPAKTGGW